MFKVTTVGKRSLPKLVPHTVLSLDAASPQLGVGTSTTCPSRSRTTGFRCQEAPVVAVGLARLAGQAARPGGRPAARAGPAVHGRLSRVSAPVRSAARVSIFTGAASYDPLRRPATSSATLGEVVSSPVRPPLATADVTTTGVVRRVGADLAISARGLGVFNPPYGAAQTDSYAAIYEHAAASLRRPRRSRSPRTLPAAPRAARA